MTAEPTDLASPLLPGGSIISALFDREVMAFADRGGASNLIGERWADLAADYAASWIEDLRPIHRSDGRLAPITRVDRLDDIPRVAAVASKHGMQNPDLLLIAEHEGDTVIQAADAKFSVETARAKQVSPEVVRGLLDLKPHVPGLLAGVSEDAIIEHGVFLCPDYPLTHLMLRRRYGIVRTTVQLEDVAFVPVAPDEFWTPVEGAAIMPLLAAVDDLPVAIEESLLAGLYYFRLARAAVGCWLDGAKPLLLYHHTVAVDYVAIVADVGRRITHAASAIELVLRWNADVEIVRRQRSAVEQAAGFPISGRELRELVGHAAAQIGAEPPSTSQVRRRLGAWYKQQISERVGPIAPPVADLSVALRQVATAGRAVAPSLPRQVAVVVQELVAGNSNAAE